MSKRNLPYHWAKQELAENCEILDCPEYDPIKDFYRDPTGYYVLIRADVNAKLIEVAICSKDHQIEKIFSGRKSQDLYFTIFQHEKKNNMRWFEDKSHIAYLGKELKKAEVALTAGSPAYVQE